MRPILTVMVAALLACGGHEPSPAPPDGGGTGGGNPGGGDGGNPGGGGGSQPGGGDGGSQPGGGGGGTQPGGGSGGGGTSAPPSDPSVTIRRVDSDPECDGLLPSSAPPAVTAEISGSPSCGPGTSDGHGHVAARREAHRTWQVFQVFSPDGKPGQTMMIDPRSPVFPQERGFLSAWGTGGTGSHDFQTVEIHAFDSDGSLLRSETPTTPDMWIRYWKVAEDPRGGLLLVANGFPPPDVPAWCHGHVFRFRADGAQRGPATLGCALVGGAVSNRGESLVLDSSQGHPPADQFRTFVDWLDADGSRAAAESSETTLSYAALAPLLDGSIAVGDGSGWTRRFQRLAPASEAAPGWLRSRAQWSFRFTRGNRAYAMFPPTGQTLADCDPGLEVRAPSGRLCGTITFREEGGACTTAALDQGWDGTVVQQSARSSCRYRWWPRLLAGD